MSSSIKVEEDKSINEATFLEYFYDDGWRSKRGPAASQNGSCS